LVLCVALRESSSVYVGKRRVASGLPESSEGKLLTDTAEAGFSLRSRGGKIAFVFFDPTIVFSAIMLSKVKIKVDGLELFADSLRSTSEQNHLHIGWLSRELTPSRPAHPAEVPVGPERGRELVGTSLLLIRELFGREVLG